MTADPLSPGVLGAGRPDPARHRRPARGGDATVNELAEPYDVSVQAVSKHLKVLEDAGLVSRAGTRSAGRCTSKRRCST